MYLKRALLIEAKFEKKRVLTSAFSRVHFCTINIKNILVLFFYLIFNL